MTNYQPRIGDYGVVRSTGFFAKLIRIGTTSRWNHAFIYIGDYMGVDSVVEANPKGVEISPVSKYSKVAWNMHEKLTREEREAIIFHARCAIGKPYNYGIIFVLALRALGVKILPKKVIHFFAKSNGYICSELVAECYEKSHASVGIEPDLCNPGDLAERLIWQ